MEIKLNKQALRNVPIYSSLAKPYDIPIKEEDFKPLTFEELFYILFNKDVDNSTE